MQLLGSFSKISLATPGSDEKSSCLSKISVYEEDERSKFGSLGGTGTFRIKFDHDWKWLHLKPKIPDTLIYECLIIFGQKLSGLFWQNLNSFRF